jgi:hypothetical protein
MSHILQLEKTSNHVTCTACGLSISLGAPVQFISECLGSSLKQQATHQVRIAIPKGDKCLQADVLIVAPNEDALKSFRKAFLKDL